MSVEEFIPLERPPVEPLITDTDGRPLIARNSLTLMGGLGGSGKTTLFVELACHLAAGVDFGPFLISKPVSLLLIENEGPEELFAAKLEAKLASFPHELKARIGVFTADWGGFNLGEGRLRDRLRDDIAEHGYDLIFGDPLDSLGIEGVGSPEDTRRFLELMKDTGLHKSAAWWLNTHPRKEQTREALNEIAGAWGGKPDAVLLLRQLADDRSEVRFPKLRWSSRGRRPTILLGFNVESESFAFLGEDGDEGRDYLSEIKRLLADHRWRTAKEISSKRESDEPGIGANEKTVKKTLESHPAIFEVRTGEAAKTVGRSATATIWTLAETVRQGDNAPDSPSALTGEDQGGESLHPVSMDAADSPHHLQLFETEPGSDSGASTKPHAQREDAERIA